MNKSKIIAYIEDSDVDFDLFMIALEKHDLCESVHRLSTLDEAFEYLRSIGRSERAAPDLFIVDLNLNGLSGLEAIHEAKKIPRLSKTSVIVLSTSNSPKEINESYLAGAKAYLSKPIAFEEFEVLVDKIASQFLRSPGTNILLV